jgi:hypothetical protein
MTNGVKDSSGWRSYLLAASLTIAGLLVLAPAALAVSTDGLLDNQTWHLGTQQTSGSASSNGSQANSTGTSGHASSYSANPGPVNGSGPSSPKDAGGVLGTSSGSGNTGSGTFNSCGAAVAFDGQPGGVNCPTEGSTGAPSRGTGAAQAGNTNLRSDGRSAGANSCGVSASAGGGGAQSSCGSQSSSGSGPAPNQAQAANGRQSANAGPRGSGSGNAGSSGSQTSPASGGSTSTAEAGGSGSGAGSPAGGGQQGGGSGPGGFCSSGFPMASSQTGVGPWLLSWLVPVGTGLFIGFLLWGRRRTTTTRDALN